MYGEGEGILDKMAMLRRWYLTRVLSEEESVIGKSRGENVPGGDIY